MVKNRAFLDVIKIALTLPVGAADDWIYPDATYLPDGYWTMRVPDWLFPSTLRETECANHFKRC